MLESNIKQVRQNIATAARKSGRDPSEITLIAATKYATAAEINEAIALGITDIGENRVQDLLVKFDSLTPVNIHFIGTLQTNKVKYIIDKVCLIHSVDNLKLAAEIDRQAKNIDKIQDILVQVNFWGEETKSGISPNEIYEFLENLDEFQNISVRGIMLIAPKIFVTQLLGNCKRFVLDIQNHFCNNVNVEHCIVSFGMSRDFQEAILLGSTAVRIGRQIFKNSD